MSRMDGMGRRRLLQSLLGAGGLAALGAMSSGLLSRRARATAPAFDDYRALVCVFLYGGNDSFNMLLPLGGTPGTRWEDYAAGRGSLAAAGVDLALSTAAQGASLRTSKLASGTGNPYHVDGKQASAYLKGYYDLRDKGLELGVNAVMPELAQLIADDRASVLANVGTLARPVRRVDVLGGTASLPLFLFSHNHQQRELQTGQADNLDDTGWAGRLADGWQGVNGDAPLPLNISYFGNDRMLIGNDSSPLVLRTSTPAVFSGMEPTGNSNAADLRATFQALAGVSGSSSSGRVTFAADRTFQSDDLHQRLYGRMLTRSMATFDTLRAAWDATPLTFNATGPYGEPLFDVPGADTLGFDDPLKGSLIPQLEAVTRMIHMGASGRLGFGVRRQVFFVVLGGFDTHSAQREIHPLLLRELSLGLWKFQTALEELGHARKVTTFTMSDFGRTITNNGDGTDHAWGGHQVVMGGDGSLAPGTFNGGVMLGGLPDLRPGGGDDYSDRGRIIPTLAQDQVNATIARWFGAEDALLATLFPNLERFRDGPYGASALMESMFVGGGAT